MNSEPSKEPKPKSPDSDRSASKNSSSLNPLTVLQNAIKAVPAVKYALGVAGIVAAVAIVRGYGMNPQMAVFGAVILFVLMVTLVIFAKLTTTKSKHFFMPVMVLMWSFLALTIVTAFLLFTTVFFKWPRDMRELIPSSSPLEKEVEKKTELRQPIDHLLQAAKMQGGAGDYEAAWKTLEKALEVQPDSRPAREQQLQLGMVWLRNIRKTGEETFEQKVDPLLAYLYEALPNARGTLAADIQAHIGLAHFLRDRFNVKGFDVPGEYKKALAIDATNPFAHAMWGHWILWHKEPLAEAQKHFTDALQSGREQEVVRYFQIEGLKTSLLVERSIEFIRVANEMRKRNETLSANQRKDIISYVYFTHRDEVLAMLPEILPADEHLATFVWLIEDLKPTWYQTFSHARLTEATGDFAKALSLYQSFRGQWTILEEETEQAIARCQEKIPKAKAGLSKHGPDN